MPLLNPVTDTYNTDCLLIAGVPSLSAAGQTRRPLGPGAPVSDGTGADY